LLILAKKLGMFNCKYTILISFFLLPFIGSAQKTGTVVIESKTPIQVTTGAQKTKEYLPLLAGKRVALLVNQTSLINNTHLADSLIRLGVKIKKVFTPEHGFRGSMDAGEGVATTKDAKTGLLLVSLYGDKKKPTAADLADVDIVVYDIQDVGVRFYTYISTLHYMMEACAENKKPLVILDRPNPNGYFVDGPVLDKAFSSFVGVDPVPVVYGLTAGEYASMVNGEGWLAKGLKCSLTVIKCDGYAHDDYYTLPVKPSPNLPNMTSVYLYPSLCFFEGTGISVGRGTDKPFQVVGSPLLTDARYSFTPKSMEGAKSPLYKDKLCNGYDLTTYGEMIMKYEKRINLYWLIDLYKKYPNPKEYFNDYFNSLAGNDALKLQIEAGMSEDNIRDSWQPKLKAYKDIRKKYLLYKDFS
jgi:uncharacterized protein YbbC (DUF1343 family)